MIGCNCITNNSSRKVAHKFDCEFLLNDIKGSCCDRWLATQHLSVPFHDKDCKYDIKKEQPERAMWARLLVYEGKQEWVDMCIQKAKERGMKEGYTQIGFMNSITSTTVMYRKDES